MNAGFSSLSQLKRELLLSADALKTDYDDSVLALGQGVAALFASACDRKFVRGEYEDSFAADRTFWITRSYPIEVVHYVKVRRDYASGYQIVPGQPSNVVEMSGKVDFLGYLGAYGETAVINYTAGYWWDHTEDGSGTLPEGATPLPEDLRAAWVMQCRWFWDRRSITERAKAGFAKDTADGFATPAEELLQPVRSILASYRRIAP